LARRLGATDAQLASLETGRYIGFEPSWRVALEYAAAMTPVGGAVPDSPFDELARAWSAPQIVESTDVAALFNYFNRFAEALAIPVTR
jgi:alkylhydroperoxidase family enzyme